MNEQKTEKTANRTNINCRSQLKCTEKFAHIACVVYSTNICTTFLMHYFFYLTCGDVCKCTSYFNFPSRDNFLYINNITRFTKIKHLILRDILISLRESHRYTGTYIIHICTWYIHKEYTVHTL